MRGAHPAVPRIEQNPGQQAWLIVGLSISSVDAVLGENGLHFVPKRLVDDGLMLAWIALALVDEFHRDKSGSAASGRAHRGRSAGRRTGCRRRPSGPC